MEQIFDSKYDSLLVKINKPKDFINTYGTYDGEKRTIHPGRVLCTMVAIDQRYHNVEIEQIFSSYKNRNQNKKLLNCKHKTNAAFYHLQTIIKEVNNVIEQYKKEEKHTGAGVNYEYQNHILIYETESFLFQIKSNLDLIIFFLSDHIKCLKSFNTFKHSGTGPSYKAGGKILKELENKGFIELYNILEKERQERIQEIIIMRDKITHYSKLEGFINFVEDPNTGNEYTLVYLPKMPNGKRVDVYCKESFDNLLNLYNNIINFISKNIEGVEK